MRNFDKNAEKVLRGNIWIIEDEELLGKTFFNNIGKILKKFQKNHGSEIRDRKEERT